MTDQSEVDYLLIARLSSCIESHRWRSEAAAAYAELWSGTRYSCPPVSSLSLAVVPLEGASRGRLRLPVSVPFPVLIVIVFSPYLRFACR